MNSGQLGRMAVIQTLRGSHVGQALLKTLTKAATQCGNTTLLLHAQCSAEGFYQRAGFVSEGKVFTEAAIAHIKMVKQL